MKLALLKTFLWALSHLVAQKDTFAIANDLYKSKQYKSAIEVCNIQLKKLSPKDTLFEKYLFLKTHIHLESNRTNSAIEDYVNLIRLRPQNISYYTELSDIYASVGEYESTVTVLKWALKHQPKDIHTLNNLSYYSGQIKKYKDAINYANEGLKYASEPKWEGGLLNNRGYGYIGLKKNEVALDDINQAIKLDADNSFAYYYRALANIQLKRMETVCDDLSKAKNLGAITLTENLIKENCKN